MTLQPKLRFLEQDAKVLEAYLSNLGSDQFIRGAEAALLQLVVSLRPAANDPASAAAAWNQIEGARKYLDTLLSIAEKTAPPGKRVEGYELDYRPAGTALPQPAK